METTINSHTTKEELNRGVIFPYMVYAYQQGDVMKHGITKPNGQVIEGFKTHEAAEAFALSLKLAAGG
jgi:hypothetical protein